MAVRFLRCAACAAQAYILHAEEIDISPSLALRACVRSTRAGDNSKDLSLLQ
jgi:hypothetical protein